MPCENQGPESRSMVRNGCDKVTLSFVVELRITSAPLSMASVEYHQPEVGCQLKASTDEEIPQVALISSFGRVEPEV